MKEEFERFIRENQDAAMKQMWLIYQIFHVDSEQERFEQGFLAGLDFVGKHLGLNLLNITDDEKNLIDSIFSDLR